MIKSTFLIVYTFLIIQEARTQIQITSFERFNVELGSTPSGFKIFNDKLFFRAQNSSDGYELWSTSGEPNSASLLKDIFPGRQSSILNPSDASMVELNNELYFIANDNLSAGELWKTDGTEAGTKKVSFNLDFNVTQLTLIQDKIYFTIQRNGFMEVWSSDGSSPKLITKDIPSIAASTFQGRAGDTFIFSFRPTAGTSVELWRSDGTANGTYMLISGIDGNGSGSTGSGQFTQFINYHDDLYFVSRYHIYKTDGTIPNTLQVYQWNSDPFNLIKYGDVIEANDKIYFSFFKSYNLFIIESDGTEGGTTIVNEQNSGQYFLPSNLSSWNNDLIFTGADASGGTSLLNMNLTDYTVSEVKQLSATNLEPFFFSDRYLTKIIHNDTGLFFLMVPKGDYESISWFSDLTEQGTYIRPELLFVRNAISFHNEFYMPYYTPDLGIELGKSGGTESTTMLLDNINPYHTGMGNIQLISLNDQLIFNANEPTYGDELWIYKNDALELLKDIRAGMAPSTPREFIKLHDKIIFSANDGISGNELWVTEGTAESTEMLADISSGPVSSFPYLFRLFKDNVFFITGAAESNYIMSTNGFTLDTLFNIGVNEFDIRYVPEEWVAGDSLMYFITTQTGDEIWVSDGSANGTFKLKQFNVCNQLTVVNNRAYFTAIDSVLNELELWTSDGTIEGTHLVEDLGVGYSSDPQDLIAYNDWLVLSAKTDLEGREMFRSNGNTATQIMDFNPGGGNTIYHAGFEEYNGLLFFNGRKNNTGSELYSSPANNPSPDLIKDIRPGAESSFPSELTSISGNLYFQAFTDENGMELWVTDGTEAGTKLAAEMLPGDDSSTPTNMTRAGKNLFFAAETELHGRQIWMLKDEFLLAVNDPETENKFVLYPQPASDQVTIKTSEEIANVDVYDLNGKWISRKKPNSNTISIADLAGGIYFIRFVIEGRDVILKFVKME